MQIQFHDTQHAETLKCESGFYATAHLEDGQDSYQCCFKVYVFFQYTTCTVNPSVLTENYNSDCTELTKIFTMFACQFYSMCNNLKFNPIPEILVPWGSKYSGPGDPFFWGGVQIFYDRPVFHAGKDIRILCLESNFNLSPKV